MHRRQEKRRDRANEKRRQTRTTDWFVGSRGDGNWFEGRSIFFCIVVLVGEVVEEVTKLSRKEAGGDGVGVFDGCDPDAFCFF